MIVVNCLTLFDCACMVVNDVRTERLRMSFLGNRD